MNQITTDRNSLLKRRELLLRKKELLAKRSEIQATQPMQENKPILQTAAEVATDPFLRPLGIASEQRQMQDLYGKSRENVLESDKLKKMRSGFSEEKTIPFLAPIGPEVIYRNEPAPKPTEIYSTSPREIAKQAQGLAVDIPAAIAGDVIAAKGPMLLSRGLMQPIKKTAQSAAARMMNFYIKPRMTAYNFGRNPGMTVAERIGPTASRDSLMSKVTTEIDTLLGGLEETAKANPDKLVDATGVFRVIADQMKQLKALPRTYEGQLKSHMDLAGDLLDRIMPNVKRVGNKMYISPEDAINLKRAIGEIPSWNVQDPKLGSLTKTSRKAYGTLDKAIDEALPGTKDTNAAVSNLIGAKQGLEKGMMREQNKDPRGFIDVAVAGGGFMAGGVPGAAAGYIGSKIMKSAPFNTTAANTLFRGGRAIGSAGRALEYLDRPTALGQIIRQMRTKKGVSAPLGRPGLPPPASVGATAQLKKPIRLPKGLPEPQPAGAGRRAIRIPEVVDSGVIELPSVTESTLAELARKYDVPESIGSVRSTTKAFTSPESKAATEQALRARRIRMRQKR